MIFQTSGSSKRFLRCCMTSNQVLKMFWSVGLSNDTICVAIRYPTQLLIEKFSPPTPETPGFGTRFFTFKKWISVYIMLDFECREKSIFSLKQPICALATFLRIIVIHRIKRKCHTRHLKDSIISNVS